LPLFSAMKCKYCKRDIPEESIFCLHCGKSQLQTRREKQREISVPKPTQLADGRWRIRLMIDGQRLMVYGATPREAEAAARATRAGIIEAKAAPKNTQTLAALISDYIDSTSAILSPATLRGYRIIERNRFSAYMQKPVGAIDWQRMLNDEARGGAAPKTVLNAWGLVTAALRHAGLERPNVKRPQLPGSDEDFLDYLELKKFLAAVEGEPVELAALLALHSLRTSELLDLDVSQISPSGIRVAGATVPDENNKYVHKATNKNDTSRREIPILIPRLLEILPESGKAVTLHPSGIRRGLERACQKAGVTVISAHDLRRTFVSLAFHLKWDAETTRQLGGWKNLDVVNKIYRKLADADKNKDVKKMRKYYT